MGNDVIKCIKERRSIRKFKDKPVSKEKIEKILNAARWAPSGLNNQPWRFQVITEKDEITEIAECTKYSKTMKQAKVLIIVYLDSEAGYDRTKDLQGIGACCQNIWLATHSLGLGAVWNGEILNHEECVKKITKVPDHLELMAVFCIGQPAEEPESERKQLGELLVGKESLEG